jgi:hypothetical protein
MKLRTGLMLIGGAVLAALAATACGDDDDNDNGGQTTQPSVTQSSATQTSPTQAGATQTSPDAAIKAALLEAINEEYKAHATYQAVIDKFGSVAPFANIAGSEQSHIDAWKTLLTRYGIAIPADPFLGKVTAPATLSEACTAGVAAEKEDVALYDRLMKTVSAADILAVMTQQRAVSQDNHLPAFQRC